MYPLTVPVSGFSSVLMGLDLTLLQRGGRRLADCPSQLAPGYIFLHLPLFLYLGFSVPDSLEAGLLPFKFSEVGCPLSASVFRSPDCCIPHDTNILTCVRTFVGGFSMVVGS